MHHPTDMIAHTTAFVTPVVEHWLEREILRTDTINSLFTKKMYYSNIYDKIRIPKF